MMMISTRPQFGEMPKNNVADLFANIKSYPQGDAISLNKKKPAGILQYGMLAIAGVAITIFMAQQAKKYEPEVEDE